MNVGLIPQFDHRALQDLIFTTNYWWPEDEPLEVNPEWPVIEELETEIEAFKNQIRNEYNEAVRQHFEQE